jgi:hypothetical protein
MKWQKGVSGNPRGRPKKENSLTAALEAVVDKSALAAAIWKEAQRGEQWACNLIFSRLEPVENTLKLKHEAVRSEPARIFDYSRLSNEELDVFERLLQRASVGPGSDQGREVQAQPALLPAAGVAND